MYRLVLKLREMKSLFKALNKAKYSNLRDRTDKTKAELDNIQLLLQGDMFNKELQARETVAREHYVSLQKLYIAQLKQQTKIHWDGEADANTAFFHVAVNARHKSNVIHKLTDGSGVCLEEKSELRDHIVGYFSAMLGKTETTTQIDPLVLDFFNL